MTDHQQPGSTDSLQAPSEPAASQPEQSKSKTKAHAASPKTPSRWPQRLLNLAIIGALAGAGYGGWLGWQLVSGQQSQIIALEQNQNNQSQLLSREATQLKNQNNQLIKQLTELQSLTEAQSLRIDSQDKRLLSMSTTSKEDWKLLEARYLLRIANQKINTDRDATTAILQLTAADSILAELGQIDLLPLRKSIIGDITTLKLAPSVDQSGIYFRLQGLIENIRSMPPISPAGKINPTAKKAEEATANNQPELIEKDVMGTSDGLVASFFEVWEKIKGSLSRYVHYTHLPVPSDVLPPEAHRYIQESIRLQLEQAQLALMAENTEVYIASLQQAKQLINDYFQATGNVNALISEISELENTTITVQLPSISGSLSQLDSYIERLHKLEDNPKLQDTPSTGKDGIEP